MESDQSASNVASTEITEDDYPLYKILWFTSRASRNFVTHVERKDGPDQPWVEIELEDGEFEIPVDL